MYYRNTFAPSGHVMIYISRKTSAKLYANQTHGKVCWQWNWRITTCFLFKDLNSNIKWFLREFWIAMNLQSSSKSPSGQMTHVHMFVLQAGTKLKRGHVMIYFSHETSLNYMPITPVVNETSTLFIIFYFKL